MLWDEQIKQQKGRQQSAKFSKVTPGADLCLPLFTLFCSKLYLCQCLVTTEVPFSCLCWKIFWQIYLGLCESDWMLCVVRVCLSVALWSISPSHLCNLSDQTEGQMERGTELFGLESEITVCLSGFIYIKFSSKRLCFLHSSAGFAFLCSSSLFFFYLPSAEAPEIVAEISRWGRLHVCGRARTSALAGLWVGGWGRLVMHGWCRWRCCHRPLFSHRHTHPGTHTHPQKQLILTLSSQHRQHSSFLRITCGISLLWLPITGVLLGPVLRPPPLHPPV